MLVAGEATQHPKLLIPCVVVEVVVCSPRSCIVFAETTVAGTTRKGDPRPIGSRISWVTYDDDAPTEQLGQLELF